VRKLKIGECRISHEKSPSRDPRCVWVAYVGWTIGSVDLLDSWARNVCDLKAAIKRRGYKLVHVDIKPES